jgi:hypothetical protein
MSFIRYKATSRHVLCLTWFSKKLINYINELLHILKLYTFVLFPVGLVPEKPTGLTVTDITSRSAKISWPWQFCYGCQRYWIKLKKNNTLILNITSLIRRKIFRTLTPYTTYEIPASFGLCCRFYKASVFVLSDFFVF